MSKSYTVPRPPPPPPPPPGPPSSTFGNHPPVQGRRRVQPPTITTTLTFAQRYGSTVNPHSPASTLFGNSLASPLPQGSPGPLSSMSTRTSSTTITAYNPQEWGRNGLPGGRYVPRANLSETRRRVETEDVSGMEGNDYFPYCQPLRKSGALSPQQLFPSVLHLGQA